MSEMDDNREIVRAGYNTCAADYAAQRQEGADVAHLTDLLARMPPGAAVLDAGCGSGVPIAKRLLQHGCRVTGVDIAQEQVRLARENCPDGTFVCADLANVDFPAGTFDAIVSFYAIFHLPRTEHPQLLASFARWLKPGGYLLATMGAGAWEEVAEFHGVPMYWSHYGREQNLALIREAGFEMISEMVDERPGERHLIVCAQKPLLRAQE